MFVEEGRQREQYGKTGRNRGATRWVRVLLGTQ